LFFLRYVFYLSFARFLCHQACGYSTALKASLPNMT
jgi:hypothetical protein